MVEACVARGVVDGAKFVGKGWDGIGWVGNARRQE